MGIRNKSMKQNQLEDFLQNAEIFIVMFSVFIVFKTITCIAYMYDLFLLYKLFEIWRSFLQEQKIEFVCQFNIHSFVKFGRSKH